MAVPDSFAVMVLINGVNVIDNCPYEDMNLDDTLNAVSKFSFRLENPSITPAKYDEVQVVTTELDPNHTVFIGYIIELKEEKHENTFVVDYAIDCADRKIRLQKSVVPPKTYTGIDTDILDDLLADTYPDLSSIFDFSGAESIASDLTLPANDVSLWDALKDLQDKTGAKMSVGEPEGNGGLITFENEGSWQGQVAEFSSNLGWYLTEASFFYAGGLGSGGNPDTCVLWTQKLPSSITGPGQTVIVRVNFGGEYIVTRVEFDYFVAGNSNFEAFEAFTGQESAIAGTGAWHHASFDIDSGSTPTGVSLGLRSTATINGNLAMLDLRIDNVLVTTETAYAGAAGKDRLTWGFDSPDADFDIDIDLSNEFGFNFNPTFGSWDDFNAVIVTGGNKNEAWDNIYDADGSTDRIQLERPVTDIVVYRNTGNDESPIWTALTVGAWGPDELGTFDTLYDSQYHWLYFNVNPANLTKSVRVVGNVQKPIRVVIQGAETDEPILATTIFDDTIGSEAEAIQKGAAELNKRNVLQRLEFDTYNPWLKVGTKMHVVDSGRALDMSILINRVSAKWIGSSGHAHFHVVCGEDEDAGAGYMIASNEKQSRKKAELIEGASAVFDMLFASDGSILYNSDGTALYQT